MRDFNVIITFVLLVSQNLQTLLRYFYILCFQSQKIHHKIINHVYVIVQLTKHIN